MSATALVKAEKRERAGETPWSAAGRGAMTSPDTSSLRGGISSLSLAGNGASSVSRSPVIASSARRSSSVSRPVSDGWRVGGLRHACESHVDVLAADMLLDRPSAEGIQLTGHHEILLPLLHAAVAAGLTAQSQLPLAA